MTLVLKFNIPSTGVKVDYGNANDVRQAGCKQAYDGLTIEFQDWREVLPYCTLFVMFHNRMVQNVI